jgi:riboflavin synthase
MFSGLVEHLGQIVVIENRPPGKRFSIEAGQVSTDAQVGDSIAVSGCCLTVVETQGTLLWFEAGSETLSRTTLGDASPGSAVNIERSLRVSDRLGGHLVTGHVDAVARVAQRKDENDWAEMWFEFPTYLSNQIASKGSIAVDGISLTVVDVRTDRFSVALIPHTLKVTTLGLKKVGDIANLETDLVAKYVAKQCENYLEAVRTDMGDRTS